MEKGNIQWVCPPTNRLPPPPKKLHHKFKALRLCTLHIFIYANITALPFLPEFVHWWNKEKSRDERINLSENLTCGIGLS